MRKIYSLLLISLVIFASVGCKEAKPQELSFSQLMEQSSPEQIEAWYNCSSCLDEEYTKAHAAELRMQKKLIVFDLDGTLSNHKSPMPEESRALLDALGKKYHLAMCGAGTAPRIYKQMGNYPIDIIGNYGMQLSKVIDGELQITKQIVCDIDLDFLREKTDYLRQKYGYTEFDGESLELHKTGLVTFALLGTKAPKEKKLVFDPDRAKRRVMYPEVLEIFKDYTVLIAGSSSFDIAHKLYNKYDATIEYAKLLGYTKDQVLFVGDDLGDGGGDSHVRLAGMDYIHILDYTKVAEKMAFLLE